MEASWKARLRKRQWYSYGVTDTGGGRERGRWETSMWIENYIGMTVGGGRGVSLHVDKMCGDV